MSSIFGRVNLDDRPLVSDDLSPMLGALAYWGPDRTDIWMKGGVGLGQIMLYNSPGSFNEKLPFYEGTSQ